MPDGRDAIAVRIVERIADIPAADWDACAAGAGAAGNPFLSHCFLNALEESGSVSAETGWQPYHLVVEDTDDRLLGVAPLYVKSHSQGEYVFDYGWGHAYEQAGGQYYPKLQCAVPFSPVTGARLLIREDAATFSPVPPRQAIAAGLAQIGRRTGVSSVHVTFCSREDAETLEQMGFLIRHGHQFHWHNQGYETFDDFLAVLTSRRRKTIRKERRKVTDMGINVRSLSGDDIKPSHWDDFYRFYVSTYDRKWGYPYLTRDLFALLQERMADNVVLMMAELDGENIAGALNLRGDDALFGRNWGCDIRFKFLHFEACYYSAIAYAIEHGLARVEAGTQGPHKLHRGYRPVRTYSAHWIENPGFERAVADYLSRERREEAAEMREFEESSPYRSVAETADSSQKIG
jgi:predicted N-acyltransferase